MHSAYVKVSLDIIIYQYYYYLNYYISHANASQYIIYAWSDLDDVGYHGLNRGTASLTLLSSVPNIQLNTGPTLNFTYENVRSCNYTTV